MKPRAFYNDNDPRVCAWVRELMADGLIMEGDVDECSIKEIQPEELRGYTRIHLFCGISGWDLALQLAGWPAERHVLTCSAPCQSFSCAGQGKGVNDPRHLWPEAFRLIRALKPQCVFGEQVEAAIKHGWLDGVFADMEGENFTCGAAVLGAHSVSAPHIRQRLYFTGVLGLGHAQGIGRNGRANDEDGGRWELTSGHSGAGGSGLADSNGGESSERELQRSGGLVQQPKDEATGGLEHTAGHGREQRRATSGERGVERGCESSGVDNATGDGAERGQLSPEPGCDGAHHRLSRAAGHWDDYELIPCADGKARRVPKSGLLALSPGLPDFVDGGWCESDGSIRPLAANVKGRVGLLRGAGNSIVPQVAAQFIKAVMDLEGGDDHAKEAKKEKVRRLLKPLP